MKRSVHIISVVHINKSGVIIIESPTVIVNKHIAYTIDPVLVIVDIDLADLGDATVVIVINRYVFYLNDRPIIVVLCIRTIVVSGVKSHPVALSRNVFIDREIEFPVRIYRKGDTVLNENKRVIVAIRTDFRNLIV